MECLTVEQHEAAVGELLYRLVHRLLEDYRRSGNVLRAPLVRDAGRLATVANDLELAAGDCRRLLEHKGEAAANI